jgi:hypothetical protein
MTKRRDRVDSEEQPKDVVLLADEPADSDEFAAKGHAAVAETISQLVRNEPGGKVIGLEGSWGSGKSTIVKLIRGQFQDTSQGTLMLVFDAWAHQGDPLRRTFLESLVRSLEKAAWLTSDEATDFQASLSGKKTRAETHTTARLSLEGKIASAAAVLLPLGAALFGNDFKTWHRPAIYVGTALLLGPLLVVAGFLIAKYVGVALDGRSKGRRDWRRRLAELRPFSFFARDQQTETVSEGVQAGEPTSVEFEHTFNSVMETALVGGRRLLIVLDNLDRVAESDAKLILATMQTFTAAAQAANWGAHVWTLIPYDAVGLDRLWDEKHVGEDEALTSPTAAAFVEKVFQVRFEAPPLVLSDWREYLVRLLAQAFPTSTEEDRAGVLRVRAQYPAANPEGMVTQEAPTPRQLKQFVNQMGSVRRQRSDISLAHIAYYTLLRRDRIDIARSLIAGAVPHSVMSPLLEATVSEDLAALHFGAERSLAQQLLLGGALERAIGEGDTETVAQLKERTGFLDVLGSWDVARLAASGGIELTRAIAVLDRSGALADAGVDEWLGHSVLPIAQSNAKWSLSGRESGAGLAVLLDQISSSDDAALHELLMRIDSAPLEADVDGHLQLLGVAALAESLLGRGRPSDAITVQVEVAASELVARLAFLSAQAPQTAWAAIRLLLSSADAAAAMLNSVTASDVTSDTAQAFAVLLARPENVDLAALTSGCAQWVREQDPSSAAQLALLLDVFEEGSSRLESDATLAGLASDGSLMHMVSLAQRNDWITEAARCQMLHLRLHPDFPAVPATREAAQGQAITTQSLADPNANPALTDAQAVWLNSHRDDAFGLLMELYEGPASPVWVDEHIRRLDEDSALKVSAPQFVSYWRTLSRALGKRFDALARALTRAQRGRQAITKSSDAAFALSVLSAVDASEEAPDYIAELVQWASQIIVGVPQADWEAGLLQAEGSPLLELANAVAGRPGTAGAVPNLASALHRHHQSLMSGEDVWMPDADRFASITRLIGGPARKAEASAVCADLEGKDGVVDPSFFKTYGKFLQDERSFRTHQKLPYFIERAVAADEWESVSGIVDLAKRHSDTVDESHRQDELQHLKTSVASKIAELKANDIDPPMALHDLANLLA